MKSRSSALDRATGYAALTEQLVSVGALAVGDMGITGEEGRVGFPLRWRLYHGLPKLSITNSIIRQGVSLVIGRAVFCSQSLPAIG